MKFVVCMENTFLGDFSADDLTIGRLYEVIGEVDIHQMLRIIDDSAKIIFTRQNYLNRWTFAKAQPSDYTPSLACSAQ